MRAMLKSERFFDSTLRGAKIKSPSEAVLGLMNEIDRGLSAGEDAEQLNKTRERIRYLGQPLGMPPDVFGWPENDGDF